MSVETPHADSPTRRLLARTAALGVLVAVAGYVVFRFFAVEVKPDPWNWGLPVFSVLAAFAAFFSPCSFPLLPGYVSHVASGSSPKRRAAVRPALGVAVFGLLLGAVVALAGTAVASSFSVRSGDPSLVVLGVRGAIGVALVGLGIYAVLGRTIPTGWLDHLARPIQPGDDPDPGRRLTLYGFGYVAAGLGCSGPILAGLVLFAVSLAGPVVALGSFVVFAATLTILMYAVTRMALVTDERLERLSRASPRVKAAVGAVQAAIGGFVLLTVAVPSWFARTFFPGVVLW